MGLGFALFLSEKMGLALLGLGCVKMGMEKEMNKMGLGFALFLSGKMWLASLGLGCLKVGMGKKYIKWEWDLPNFRVGKWGSFYWDWDA